MSVIPMPKTELALDICLNVLNLEIKGLQALEQSLANTPDLEKAAMILFNTKGRVIVSGMGKSGHIGRKIAATFASTGQPSSFVHPSEASHGDLGMVTEQDTLFLLSNSGETRELNDLMTYGVRYHIPIIGISGRKGSTLDRLSTASICLPDVPEACPMGLAPTTSTTLMMALGDALAITLLTWRGFTNKDFKQFHPGGRLGQQLAKVEDKMHTQNIPLVFEETLVSECLLRMTAGGFGCVGVVDTKTNLKGVITDGDLRRHMNPDLLAQRAADIMNLSPKTIGKGLLMAEALNIMETHAITSLFVVEANKPIGILHIHDFLRSGVA